MGAVFFAVLFTAGWLVLARYIPPHSPTASAADIAAWYKANHTRIIGGLVLAEIGLAAQTCFFAALSIQMARIEGRWPVLAVGAMGSGMLAAVETLIALSFWLTAAFRPDRDPDLILLLNDSGWIYMFWAASVASLQEILLGACILSDKRAQPVFPRWIAYFSFWIALCISTDNIMPFFHKGPFAWDGVLVFWMPLTTYFMWVIVITVALLKAIKRQASSDDDKVSTNHLD